MRVTRLIFLAAARSAFAPDRLNLTSLTCHHTICRVTWLIYGQNLRRHSQPLASLACAAWAVSVRPYSQPRWYAIRRSEPLSPTALPG